MKKAVTHLATFGLILTLAACACSPGHIGPYGGVHPGRCWIW